MMPILLLLGLFLWTLPAEAGEIRFTFGLTRTIDACEQAGELVRYRTSGQWYHVPSAQVQTITDVTCSEPVPAPDGPKQATPAPAALSDPSSSTPAPLPSSAYPSPSYSSPTSPSTRGPVHVDGYYRKDGKYVAPYTRSAPGSGGRRGK
jgi:hypothetical protein